MLMRVGELAKRTGLTVRALHHYDEIGLVRPSRRSPAGYRLYSDEDVRRLHAVLALRQLGLSLADIAQTLDSQQAPLNELIAAQIQAVDRDIAQAHALRAQLVILHNAIDDGSTAKTEQLLLTLSLMDTYRRHFADDEFGPLLRRWQDTRSARREILQAVRMAMQEGRSPDDAAVQSLAQRWMDWSMELTDGDLSAALRWSRMHADAPETARQQGIEPELLRYVGSAIDLRMSALRRHLSEADLLRLDTGLAPAWRSLATRAESLMGVPGSECSPEARTLLDEWDALVHRMCGGDPQLLARLLEAYRTEPILRHGHPITPQVRAFMDDVRNSLSAA